MRHRPLNLSVVVPTYGRPAEILRLLGTLRGQYGRPLEIIVVDQTPGSPELGGIRMFGRGCQVRHVRLARPSVTAAQNVGISLARGKFVAFFDDDVVAATPRLLEELVRPFSDESVGEVAGQVLEVDENANERPPEGRVNSWGRAVRNFASEWPGPVEWGPGGNCCYRRGALLSIGGFDERFLGNAFFQETEASYRCARRDGEFSIIREHR